MVPLGPDSMDPKGPSGGLCMYRETRADLEPLSPNSIIRIQLPSTGTFNRFSRPHRQILNYDLTCKDEEAFTRQHVASSGAIYFRKFGKYPRSILWRCVEGNKVLELRSVDLSKREHEKKEAVVIIRLGIPGTIRHGGIALADSQDHDLLDIFVLTKANDLYTFAIRSDLFCNAAASVDEVERAFKIYKPASFSISTPYRLYACSSLVLLVSLADGRLVRLQRKPGEDGSTWDEVAYNDGHWGSSLRGLIRWQGNNTVRYEGDSLDQNTAVAASLSPDGNHMYVVCLNHTVKCWNVDTGKVTFSRDLQDRHREPQDISKIMLEPSIPQVLQIFEAIGAFDGDRYYVVTFSPHDSGVFKFWAVRDADYGNTGIHDRFPDHILRLPDPDDSGHWTIADFKVRSAEGGAGMEIWIMIRLNRRYRLYHKRFDLPELPQAWMQDWSETSIDTLDEQAPPEALGGDPESPAEKWISYIFSPGRVPSAVIETALSVYCQGRGIQPLSTAKASVRERVASAVGSQARLEHTNTENVDFSRFDAAVYNEWKIFWTYITDLNHSQWSPLSLDYDQHADMAWITFADGCSTIRESSQTEILTQNELQVLSKNINLLQTQSVEDKNHRLEPELPDELAMLIEAAAGFRNSFSHSLLQSCKNLLKTELWQDSSYSVPDRIQLFYDRCDFAEEIGDKQYKRLATALADIGGFDGLDSASFQAIMQTFPQVMSSGLSELVSTKFGLKILMKGARQMITLHTRILTDLLLLAIFVDMEVDREENAMINFDSATVYTGLLDLLRQYHLMHWLVTSTRATHFKHDQVNEGVTLQHQWSSTMLEDLFGSDIKPRPYTNQSQGAGLTHSIQDLLKWATGGDDEELSFDQVLVNIQCNLLKNGNISLAMDFRQFQPSTAWGTYTRARLCLVCGDFLEAAIYFKKAAFNLSRSTSFNYHIASAGLLTSLDASFLGTGLPNYYAHILSLFETSHAYSQVSSFAHLALQFIPRSQNPDLHSDLLSRLFHASLEISDFDTAYSALTRYTDTALQKSAVTSLVTTMLSQNASEKLLSFPFPTLHSTVDSILADKAHQQISSPSPVASAESIPYHKILYALRLKHSDFRGAAAVLMAHLESTKSKQGRGGTEADVLEEYLLLINVLAVVSEGQDWVFVGGEDTAPAGHAGMALGGKKKGEVRKRRVVTLEDVRRGYQEELDRRSVLESGRFGIVGAAGEDGMDVL